jgi:hypothetical protein
MALAGRVYFNAHDMARFHPGLFATWQTAAHANQRAGDIETKARALIEGLPAPWIRVTWQPNGQGYKPRDTLLPKAAVHALRGEILREFPDGLAAWAVAPFSPGNARRHSSEESSKSENLIKFPDLADSSPTIFALGGGTEEGGQPAWPPDG